MLSIIGQFAPYIFFLVLGFSARANELCDGVFEVSQATQAPRHWTNSKNMMARDEVAPRLEVLSQDYAEIQNLPDLFFQILVSRLSSFIDPVMQSDPALLARWQQDHLFVVLKELGLEISDGNVERLLPILVSLDSVRIDLAFVDSQYLNRRIASFVKTQLSNREIDMYHGRWETLKRLKKTKIPFESYLKSGFSETADMLIAYRSERPEFQRFGLTAEEYTEQLNQLVEAFFAQNAETFDSSALNLMAAKRSLFFNFAFPEVGTVVKPEALKVKWLKTLDKKFGELSRQYDELTIKKRLEKGPGSGFSVAHTSTVSEGAKVKIKTRGTASPYAFEEKDPTEKQTLEAPDFSSWPLEEVLSFIEASSFNRGLAEEIFREYYLPLPRAKKSDFLKLIWSIKHGNTLVEANGHVKPLLRYPGILFEFKMTSQINKRVFFGFDQNGKRFEMEVVSERGKRGRQDLDADVAYQRFVGGR